MAHCVDGDLSLHEKMDLMLEWTGRLVETVGSIENRNSRIAEEIRRHFMSQDMSHASVRGDAAAKTPSTSTSLESYQPPEIIHHTGLHSCDHVPEPISDHAAEKSTLSDGSPCTPCPSSPPKRPQHISVPNNNHPRKKIKPEDNQIGARPSINVFAVVVSKSQVFSPPDKHPAVTTFQVSYPNRDSSAISNVQICSVSPEARPVVKAGDCVVLRRFTAHTMTDKVTYLLSKQDSYWCIFRDDSSGPTVEFGNTEQRQVVFGLGPFGTAPVPST